MRIKAPCKNRLPACVDEKKMGRSQRERESSSRRDLRWKRRRAQAPRLETLHLYNPLSPALSRTHIHYIHTRYISSNRAPPLSTTISQHLFRVHSKPQGVFAIHAAGAPTSQPERERILFIQICVCMQAHRYTWPVHIPSPFRRHSH